jgi:hypothetical protein
MSSFKCYVSQHEIYLALRNDRVGPYYTVSESLRKFGNFFMNIAQEVGALSFLIQVGRLELVHYVQIIVILLTD